METAIHFDSSVLTAFHKLKETPEVKKELRSSELAARLSELEEWEVVKKVIDDQITHLENMQGMFDPSDTVESVGFRFLAAQTAISYLKQIRDYPQTVAKAKHARRNNA